MYLKHFLFPLKLVRKVDDESSQKSMIFEALIVDKSKFGVSEEGMNFLYISLSQNMIIHYNLKENMKIQLEVILQ